MQLDKAGQAALLKLAETDLSISQIKAKINDLMNSVVLKGLQTSVTESAGELLDSRTVLENLQSSLRKAEEDLRLVVERISRDKEHLNATSSAKDAVGIQSELDSLARRQSDLEDVELGIIAEIESAEKLYQEASTKRAELQSELSKLQDSTAALIEELKIHGRKAMADRAILVEKVGEGVLKKYESLAAKQVAVGQVIDKTCTACRMVVPATVIDELNSLPEDQIGSCPQCQALIVR